MDALAIGIGASAGGALGGVAGERGGLDDNRAACYPTASMLNMPYGLAVQNSRLVVADIAREAAP